ncbi:MULTISPECIES: hypothetical protein [Bacillus]|uniref:Uncharacterized protein n=2 Tax=Bacillus anthracis TaxID=1392 RepID=A0A6L7HRW3_BACAN|nr:MULTISPECIES: hypothetical protein [Bacillus]AAM26190.1 hypothetical protein BX_B0030 [Bacillus anthracis str. A2012]EJT17350.1 hypothetical protein B353_30223 [Bacillus anthracis str. UR-1]HDR4493573.1 hypothetical protein [Bacillus cereus biovar anthracis]AAT28960.2 hypothetical protein GBAA_pXO2_0030 [Bacillus anthracis str. 'Ames Ancestor']ACP11978.1 hypothetical protein BAMEG_B0027 [Bacillus anthracis str. CDC 684]
MAYQVPKCDCGNNLMYMFDKLYHEEFKITKNGVPFKHRYDFCDILEDAWREKLGCTSCDNGYEVEYDKLGRFIRGVLL